MNTRFEDLRPYSEQEIAPAMQRIADSVYFPVIAKYIFPDRDVNDVRRMVMNIRTTYEFQTQVMYDFNRMTLKMSVRHLTCDGLEHLDAKQAYLFVSNHRDIVLDSSLLQYMFHNSGLRTTEISFGSNLMSSQVAVDIGKSNKMYTVKRGGNLRDFYTHSLHLSSYLRHTLTEKRESVWIAQRNGRTKDGNDLTDQGIIKMFCMSDATDPVRSLAALHPVPVAISYQIEPCDILKTRERYLSRNGQKYIKQSGEDMQSILTGIMQPKGDIHIRVCKPLAEEELADLPCASPNEFYRKAAMLIDARIRGAYKLHDNNYIAHDLRSGRAAFASLYTQEGKTAFLTRCEQMLREVKGEEAALRDIFLGIYANPVEYGR
jgi:hypothetical protein